MMNKNSFLMLCMAAATTTQAAAQTEFAHSADTWHEGAVNSLFNSRYNSMNPTRLAYNRLQTTGEATVGYGMTRGSLHDTGTPGHINDLSVMLGGLKHFDKVDLAGHLHYVNTNYKNQEWNSTLFLNSNNPFVLADSVASDGNIERFDMGATLSVRCSDKVKAGIAATLLVGSMSDQTDPRPKTNTSRFGITAGADIALDHAWTIGAAARAELLNSNISYTIVNPLVNHRYFLMKGMGDYFRRSSSEDSGYQREYKGTTFTGELSAAYRPNGSPLQNVLIVTAVTGNEDATDGGSAYTFKGGDYSFTRIAVKDRLMFSHNERVLHNIVVGTTLDNANGDWYDQKKLTDTEHGNISYYEVLSTARIHKQSGMELTAEYRVDRLNDRQCDFYASALVVLESNTVKHYNDAGMHKQQYANLSLDITTGKHWTIGNGTLAAQLSAGYVLPAKDRTFATGTNVSGSDDITGAYATRQFEYASAKRLRVGAATSYTFAVAQAAQLGFFAKGHTSFYEDDAQYCAALKGTSATRVELGATLNF